VLHSWRGDATSSIASATASHHAEENRYENCDRYRVHVCQSWGICQSYDEEHGRREVIGRGSSIVAACYDRYRVHVCQSWGACQGYDEEHGRWEAIGYGPSIEAACHNAREHAEAADINRKYLMQTLSLAKDAAEEMIAN